TCTPVSMLWSTEGSPSSKFTPNRPASWSMHSSISGQIRTLFRSNHHEPDPLSTSGQRSARCFNLQTHLGGDGRERDPILSGRRDVRPYRLRRGGTRCDLPLHAARSRPKTASALLPESYGSGARSRPYMSDSS